MSAPLPLDGIRILEAGTALAVPLATRFLADMGAEVIKVESCRRPEVGRFLIHPDGVPGAQPWETGAFYHEANRNKFGVSLDLSSHEGRNLFKQLVHISDVVVENFTPRVMKNWELDYDSLAIDDPNIIYLSSTGYGHSGPWRDYKAYGMTLAPTCGLSHFTGHESGPPIRNVISYTDTPAAMFNAFAVLCALEFRDGTGRGQWIDTSQYEMGVTLIAEGLAEFLCNGVDVGRHGNEDHERSPSNVYPCLGADAWVAIAVETDPQWRALTVAMGRPDLTRDQRLESLTGRLKHRHLVDEAVAQWTSTQSKHEVQQALQSMGIAAGAVQNTQDLFFDPQLQDRGFFERVKHPSNVSELGTRVYPGGLWRTERFPGPFIRRPAPMLGGDNHTVLEGLLGLPGSDVDRLEEEGVIGSRPTLIPEARAVPVTLDDMLVQGTITATDPDYRTKLADVGQQSAQKRG